MTSFKLDVDDARAGVRIVDPTSSNCLRDFEIQFAAYGDIHCLVYGPTVPHELEAPGTK